MIIITMALLNFFSRLTYENILSPMILARSGNNSVALGVVNAVIGIGGIIGGIIVSTGKVKGNNSKMIYISAMLSFLLGDVMMGAGSGMAIMFLCTGVSGAIFSFISYKQKAIRELDV